MAIPTENLAISYGIIIGISVFVVCFPCSRTSAPPILPNKLLVTPFSFMKTVFSSALTSSFFVIKADFNLRFWKCHIGLLLPWCRQTAT